jgi:glutathione peroxidase
MERRERITLRSAEDMCAPARGIIGDVASGAADDFVPPLILTQRVSTVVNRLCLLSLTAGLAALLIGASFAVVSAADPAKKATSVLDFHVKDIEGKDVDLASYKGKVLLIVNTASQCGYTKQYKDLEAFYEKFKSQGFEVLAFPANEFGKQEPGTNEQIKEFCSTKYNVSFPLFSKIVVKGKGIDPLFDFLTSDATNPKFAGPIKWNFNKFVVDRKGEVIARFEATRDPNWSEPVVAAIEKALAEK